MQIYTVGTANRSKEEFVLLLHSFGIEAVVDVRRFPTSKFAHFRREELEEMLRGGHRLLLLRSSRRIQGGRLQEAHAFRRISECVEIA